MARPLDIEWHGAVRYADGLALQDRAVAQRIAGDRNDRVLLLEHPAVVTLGRSTDPANLRLTPDEMRDKGIDVFEVGRGGDVTYHAPGQLVGYPVLDLDGLGWQRVVAHDDGSDDEGSRKRSDHAPLTQGEVHRRHASEAGCPSRRWAHRPTAPPS